MDIPEQLLEKYYFEISQRRELGGRRYWSAFFGNDGNHVDDYSFDECIKKAIARVTLSEKQQEKKECICWSSGGHCQCACHGCISHVQPPPSPEPTEKCSCHPLMPCYGCVENASKQAEKCSGDHGLGVKCENAIHLYRSILSPSDQSRITQIRANLEIFQEKGMDTSSWESTFFLELIEKLQKEIKSEK